MFLWMRFDEERVGALFRRAEHCFTDAEFRAIVKSHSSLPIERKDIRLADLLIDIQLLLENCLMHFATKGAYDTIINIRKEEYYRINEKKLLRRCSDLQKEVFWVCLLRRTIPPKMIRKTNGETTRNDAQHTSTIKRERRIR